VSTKQNALAPFLAAARHVAFATCASPEVCEKMIDLSPEEIVRLIVRFSATHDGTPACFRPEIGAAHQIYEEYCQTLEDLGAGPDGVRELARRGVEFDG